MTHQSDIPFDWKNISDFILNNSVEYAVDTVVENNYAGSVGHYIIALDLAEELNTDAADLPNECTYIIPLLMTEDHYIVKHNEINKTDSLEFAQHLLQQIKDPDADTAKLLTIINDALELYPKAMYGE